MSCCAPAVVLLSHFLPLLFSLLNVGLPEYCAFREEGEEGKKGEEEDFEIYYHGLTSNSH
jgi:hypothetical protein